MSRKILNAPGDAVVEFLEGLVASVPHLRRLDGFPEIKVILDGTADKSKVALISGGGSGHEPAHAGYVGCGMLTAAVCGDVFASPPTEAVLAAIRAVGGPAGVLLIVKNYTGDRLNFGLAAEQAKAEGVPVEMVIVGDDAALDAHGIAGRRGIAGTVFVHKVAGAAALAGLTLQEVKQEAEAAASKVASMGVATSICTLPGSETSTRLAGGSMELGLGIHGEPGAATTVLESSKTIVAKLLERIMSKEAGYLPLQPGARVALLVNSLGASPPMELYVVARDALAYLKEHRQMRVERVYVGLFMTALDMAGVSLSLLEVDDARLLRLDAPTQAPAWPATPPVVDSNKAPIPVPAGPSDDVGTSGRPAELSPHSRLLEMAITAACHAIIKLAPDLDAQDRLVGDGDCGATLLTGANAVLREVSTSYPVDNPSATLRALARSLRAMGGTSGAIYNIGLTAASGKLQPCDGIGGVGRWAEAASAAAAAIQTYGGARAGDRTLLDALIPASEALQAAAAAPGASGGTAARAAATAAAEGAAASAQMTARAGRTSYVPDDVSKGVPDPGATAVAGWMAAVADALVENS